MAVYCNNPKCPVVSINGFDNPVQHGRKVRCFGCGKFVSKKKGK